MININCNGCSNHCCGENPHLTPILMRDEEREFKDFARRIDTPYGPIYKLNKKSDGNCIFLNDEKVECNIYERRPLECRLYPLLLNFSKQTPRVSLDGRYCPHLDLLQFDESQIEMLLKTTKFPKDWIRAYKSLENC